MGIRAEAEEKHKAKTSDKIETPSGVTGSNRNAAALPWPKAHCCFADLESLIIKGRTTSNSCYL